MGRCLSDIVLIENPVDKIQILRILDQTDGQRVIAGIHSRWIDRILRDDVICIGTPAFIGSGKRVTGNRGHREVSGSIWIGVLDAQGHRIRETLTELLQTRRLVTDEAPYHSMSGDIELGIRRPSEGDHIGVLGFTYVPFIFIIEMTWNWVAIFLWDLLQRRSDVEMRLSNTPRIHYLVFNIKIIQVVPDTNVTDI